MNGSLAHTVLTFVGIYAPNVGQAEFWEHLQNKAPKDLVRDIIVLGDFNAIIDKGLDSSRRAATSRLQRFFFLRGYDLIAIWWETKII